jgi:biofilm PGA synthesis N-glycosyltransferase PgaC
MSALPSGFPPVTIVVAVRDEAAGIQRTLQALLQQRYIESTLIVVDDHSLDTTTDRVRALCHPRVRCLPNQGVGKRAALSTGISAADEGVVLLTDGDCLPGPLWAWNMCQALARSGVHWVSGPVIVAHEQDLRTCYDALESHGLMLLTGASFGRKTPEMAQGASIAFRKRDYTAVGGYTQLPDFASGDDVFLMELFRRRFPDGCRFLMSEEAMVVTRPVGSWRALLRQRHRWASKSGGLARWQSRMKMGLVWGVSGWWLVAAIMLPFTSALYMGILLLLLLLKIGADGLLLYEATGFGGRRFLMRVFPAAVVIHPLVVVYVGVLSMLSFPVRWKGRRVK